MSKTIKVIDLLNKIANGEEAPKKIKVKDYIFIWKVSDNGTGYYNVKEDTGYYWLEDYISLDDLQDLNTEIEIIEEEPEIDIQGIEEIEEFDIQGLEVSGYSMTDADYLFVVGIEESRKIINQLIKAVKQLDKRINNK